MSNDIDKKLWRIQEQAMDKIVASELTKGMQESGLQKVDLQELREYQNLYELLQQQPEGQPSPLLANAVSKQIKNRHSKQRASKLLTYLFCSLMAVVMIVGLVILLPQSALLHQLSLSIPLPLILTAMFAVSIVGLLQRGLMKRKEK